MKVRMFVVGIALALSLVGVASASAATWRASAPTTSTVTATGPTTYLRVGSVVLRCRTSTVALTASTTSVITGPASTSAWNHVPSGGSPTGTLTITPKFADRTCDISGTPYSVRCNADESPAVAGAFFNANANGTTGTAANDGGFTTGGLSGVNCQILAAGGVLCTTITSTGTTVSGFTDRVGVTVTYGNPDTSGSVNGSVVINGSGQTLTSTSNSCAAIPSGAANFTSSSTGAAANVTYTIPFAGAPSIWAA